MRYEERTGTTNNQHKVRTGQDRAGQGETKLLVRYSQTTIEDKNKKRRGG